MPPVSASGALISMTAVSLVDFVTAQQAAQQGERGIDHEHTEQDQPAPHQPWRDPGGLQRHDAQGNPQKAAAGVAHEYPRRREIPEQEARHRAGQQQRQPDTCRLGALTWP